MKKLKKLIIFENFTKSALKNKTLCEKPYILSQKLVISYKILEPYYLVEPKKVYVLTKSLFTDGTCFLDEKSFLLLQDNSTQNPGCYQGLFLEYHL